MDFGTDPACRTALAAEPADAGAPAWSAAGAPARERAIESGEVLALPGEALVLRDDELRFLDPRWADGKSKNIAVRANAAADDASVRGARGTPADLAALHRMIRRFREHAAALVDRNLPHYRGRLRQGTTSFRPVRIEDRHSSWRKDDTRLHVDAFPSNPTQGVRLLRVFCNVHPGGVPRVWHVGEPFEAFARRFLGRTRRMPPGAALVLRAARVTKSLRSEYDHLMLQLHDAVKADAGYQASAPRRVHRFAPGTAWICFSDQVLHAAVSGQFAFETTFLIDVDDLLEPERSPLRVLERLTGRRLARGHVASRRAPAHS